MCQEDQKWLYEVVALVAGQQRGGLVSFAELQVLQAGW